MAFEESNFRNTFNICTMLMPFKDHSKNISTDPRKHRLFLLLSRVVGKSSHNLVVADLAILFLTKKNGY